MLDAFASLLAWGEAHPELTALALGSLLTFIFKPKTPDQYQRIERLSPRLAALLQLMGAIFFDVAKASAVSKKLVTGKSSPPPPPVFDLSDANGVAPSKEDSHREAIRSAGATSGVVRVAAAAMVFATMIGCTADARRALLEKGFDVVQCALANMDLPNDEIALKCALQAEDAERVFRILGDAREAKAKAIEQARFEASSMQCKDAGAE